MIAEAFGAYAFMVHEVADVPADGTGELHRFWCQVVAMGATGGVGPTNPIRQFLLGIVSQGLGAVGFVWFAAEPVGIQRAPKIVELCA